MKNRRGAIATLLTIGALVVIGITAITSSFFINQKKTTNSKAAERVSCDDVNWICGSECASPAVRLLFGNNAAKWRTEAARNLPSKNCDSSDPVPTTLPCPGGNYDKSGLCNPACCKADGECPSGQKCNISNGYCVSEFSCNANSAVSPTSSQNPEVPPTTKPTNAPTATGTPPSDCVGDYVSAYACSIGCPQYNKTFFCDTSFRCCLSTPRATIVPTIQSSPTPTATPIPSATITPKSTITPTPIKPTTTETPPSGCWDTGEGGKCTKSSCSAIDSDYSCIGKWCCSPKPTTLPTPKKTITITIQNNCNGTVFNITGFMYGTMEKPENLNIQLNGGGSVFSREMTCPSNNTGESVTAMFFLTRNFDSSLKMKFYPVDCSGSANSSDTYISSVEGEDCNLQ